MNVVEIKVELTTYLASVLGVYKPSNIPSIWVGLPPSNLVCVGVEVLVNSLPCRRRNGMTLQAEIYEITVNDWESPTSKFKDCLDLLCAFFRKFDYELIVHEIPTTRQIATLPIIKTALLRIQDARLLVST